MPSTWRDYLPAVLAEREAVHDNRDNSDNRLGGSPPSAPNVPNVAIVTGSTSLPGDLANGLLRLKSRVPPRLLSPEHWAAVVADSQRLVTEGWAAKALILGWKPLDLFGAVTDPEGDPADDGLAVWLDGRRILLLDERTCIVDAGGGRRAVFTRRAPAASVLLWDIANRREAR